MAEKKIDYDEFLELAKKLVDEQYDSLDTGDFNDVLSEYDRMTAKAEEKKEQMASQYGVLDLTSVKKADMSVEEVWKARQIKVGQFLISTGHPLGYADSLNIHEMNGKMTKRVYVLSDTRFNEAPWRSSFERKRRMLQGSTKKEFISPETLIDIVRWLQMISRVGAFV